MNNKRNDRQKTQSRFLASIGASVLAALSFGCGGDDGVGSGNEEEVITTVVLSFTPSAGGSALEFVFEDADGDGGNPPTIDPINIGPGSYSFAVTFANGLETPPEDITQEVSDEADEHQLFFVGTAVDGPANMQPGAPLTHAYADTDANGLPIGLANTITAAAGTGVLTLILRHLPELGGEPVKVTGLADLVKNGGISSIGGQSDVQIDFDVTVP